MQRRCREIGADLQINRLDPGTAITLTLHDRAWVDQYPEATG
jgi:hypothetical protein